MRHWLVGFFFFLTRNTVKRMFMFTDVSRDEHSSRFRYAWGFVVLARHYDGSWAPQGCFCNSVPASSSSGALPLLVMTLRPLFDRNGIFMLNDNCCTLCFATVHQATLNIMFAADKHPRKTTTPQLRERSLQFGYPEQTSDPVRDQRAQGAERATDSFRLTFAVTSNMSLLSFAASSDQQNGFLFDSVRSPFIVITVTFYMGHFLPSSLLLMPPSFLALK